MNKFCLGCGRNETDARHLCRACYQWHRTHGTLDQFPRLTRRSADTVEDYEFLACDGYTRRLAAERLGITKKALEKAIARRRAA